MARTNPAQFIQQVRAETDKVRWPTRRETVTTDDHGFVMAALAAVFFLLVDQVLDAFIKLVVSLGA